VPIVVAAPGRFSTTIVSPCARPIWSANKRATMSAVPAGGEGTTIFISLGACGHAVWTPNAIGMAVKARGKFFEDSQQPQILEKAKAAKPQPPLTDCHIQPKR